jgi:hypothetical protein
LIKDILEIPILKELLSKAQMIVRAFLKSPLQYSRLREYQLQFYGQHQALILSVITRWGTQFRLISSVLKNKDALRQYALDYPPKELSNNAYNIILSSEFWTQLDQLRELLQSIDLQLKISESNKTRLHSIISRWDKILEHLYKMQKTDFPFLDEFLKEDGKMSKRYQRQVLPIHIVTYYLSPINIGVSFDEKVEIPV